VNVYGSFSDIYKPQYYLNENLQPLGSAEGKSYELGLKKQFDNSMLASVALFKTEQQNLQEFVAYTENFTYALYRGINVEAKGVELEVAGNVTEALRLQAGFTHLASTDCP